MNIIKLLFYVIITVFLNTSCKNEECPRNIKDMEVYSITTDTTSESASIDGWYHSEFQTNPLHFSIEFQHYGAGESCDNYWENYPLDSTIEISCDKDIIIENDTIKANDNLINFFIIQKYEKNFFISFLITENKDKKINFSPDYYTFKIKLLTNKNEEMIDECLVKINNKKNE